MTQEDKELLLKDLCARLRYGVKVEYIKTKKQYRLHELSEDGNYFSLLHETEPTGVCSELGIEYEGVQTIKPYLRPMSSMTEEEYNEYQQTFDNVVVYNNNIHSEHRATYETFDYLNSIHVDYRDLIEKGLALEAPEDMYNDRNV